RLSVMTDWFWAYITRERSARLITGDAEELRNAVLFIQGESAAAVLDKMAKGTATKAATKV
ncbi:MAG TPA: hypothetical protein VHL50_08335, partial [Pyrinomonadaceae bacterium]|nr:hypothetical protein [Pyrinomonadaceae bacterium]